MNRLLYLLKVSVSGIKCIEEEVCLNFYKKTVDKDFNPEKYRIKAIYGENGAGKSAIITAIKIFYDFMVEGNYLNESKNQKFLAEIVNKKTKKLTISLEYLVNLDDEKLVYKYTLEIGLSDNDTFVVNYEALSCKNGNYPNNNYANVYESKDGDLININSKENVEEIKKKTTNLLSMKSFPFLYVTKLSKEEGKEEEIDKDFDMHITLLLIFTISFKIYLAEDDKHELYFLRKSLKDRNLKDETFDDYLTDIDMLSSVNEKYILKEDYEDYESKIERLTEFIRLFKRDLVSIDIDKKDNGEFYVCDLNLNYGEYSVNKEFESTGIKKLIRLFDCFNAASGIGIVFIDEMDSNLNDVYLCKIIEYFMYYGRGQLCFTTHNLDPMSVLKENKNSIEFLSSDNHLVSWTTRGNASPENCYKNGMIEDSPFNIEATDFVGILGE